MMATFDLVVRSLSGDAGVIGEYCKLRELPTEERLVEMMEDYLPPDAKGPNDLYHRRVHVRVGLEHISTQIIEDHLQYDAEEGVYYKHPRRKKP